MTDAVPHRSSRGLGGGCSGSRVSAPPSVPKRAAPPPAGSSERVLPLHLEETSCKLSSSTRCPGSSFGRVGWPSGSQSLLRQQARAGHVASKRRPCWGQAAAPPPVAVWGLYSSTTAATSSFGAVRTRVLWRLPKSYYSLAAQQDASLPLCANVVTASSLHCQPVPSQGPCLGCSARPSDPPPSPCHHHHQAQRVGPTKRQFVGQERGGQARRGRQQRRSRWMPVTIDSVGANPAICC